MTKKELEKLGQACKDAEIASEEAMIAWDKARLARKEARLAYNKAVGEYRLKPEELGEDGKR